MRNQRGGKTIYGAHIGILMLETQFPRIPGDVGNAETWPFPVLYKVVRNASPDAIVCGDARQMTDAFIAAAEELVAVGADAITTNCGFLSLIQEALAAAVRVPVATSSLMQTAWVDATLPPGQQVGILTISEASLSPAHLRAAGVPEGTPIGGTNPKCSFNQSILGNQLALDSRQCAQDVLDGAEKLLHAQPQIGALVLECTNMVPYAHLLRDSLSIPIYDYYSFLCWFHTGLKPHRFSDSW